MTAQGLHVYTSGGNTRSSACLEAMCGGAGGARQPASRLGSARSLSSARAGRCAAIAAAHGHHPGDGHEQARTGGGRLQAWSVHVGAELQKRQQGRGTRHGSRQLGWVEPGSACKACWIGWLLYAGDPRACAQRAVHSNKLGGGGSSAELFAGTQGCRRGAHTQHTHAALSMPLGQPMAAAPASLHTPPVSAGTECPAWRSPR